MDRHADQVISRFVVRLQWGLMLFAVGWLVWLLGPILTPFVLAALLAWLCDPLVDRLEASGRSRIASVILVFTAMLLLVVLALVILVPMVVDQVRILVDSLPGYRDWLLQTALPWVEARTGIDIDDWLDPTRVLEFFQEHSERAAGIASTALGVVSRSGFAIVNWGINLVLLPIVTFFFLRDWDRMMAGIASVVPRDHIGTVKRLARESSDVLGGFLRGQFLVMLILGAMYGVGLWLVGIELGLLIGLIAGLLTFVPYLGPASGLVLGVIATLVEHGDWQHLVAVLAVFGIGQLIESYWLTPKLVGDRIGLHPVAVIFAVMAGGVLFGFVGMLIALPAAAVVNVLLRFAHEKYTASALYMGRSGLADAQASPPARATAPVDAAEASMAADAVLAGGSAAAGGPGEPPRPAPTGAARGTDEGAGTPGSA